MALQQLRSEIDRIDKKIIALLNQRVQLALQIGEQKKKLNVLIEDKKREQQILKMITDHNNGPLSDRQIVNIFQTIIKACRNIQKKNQER